MIDADRHAPLRHGRRAALFATIACLSALSGLLAGSDVASYIVLTIGSVAFLGQFIVLSADLRSLSLSDSDLRKRDRYD